MMKRIFFHNGKRYEMTDEQIEAAYRFRERQFRYLDAKDQLDKFIYGIDLAALSEEEIERQKCCFWNKYLMDPEEAYGKIDKIVARFEKDADCNVDENSRWESAILAVLMEK